MARKVKPDPNLRPRTLEAKGDYLKRFLKDEDMISLHPNLTKRRVAAERTWLRAKGESLVSVTTSVDQFLIFS